jgi:hypothetical protein
VKHPLQTPSGALDNNLHKLNTITYQCVVLILTKSIFKSLEIAQMEAVSRGPTIHCTTTKTVNSFHLVCTIALLGDMRDLLHYNKKVNSFHPIL